MKTLDSNEASELLKIGVDKTLELARSGTFPAKCWGNKWVFIEEDLINWLKDETKREQEERIIRKLIGDSPSPNNYSRGRKRNSIPQI
jgi:hypothetical protein